MSQLLEALKKAALEKQKRDAENNAAFDAADTVDAHEIEEKLHDVDDGFGDLNPELVEEASNDELHEHEYEQENDDAHELGPEALEETVEFEHIEIDREHLEEHVASYERDQEGGVELLNADQLSDNAEDENDNLQEQDAAQADLDSQSLDKNAEEKQEREAFIESLAEEPEVEDNEVEIETAASNPIPSAAANSLSAIPNAEELLAEVEADEEIRAPSEETENKLKESIVELVKTTESEEKQRNKYRIIGFVSFILLILIALGVFFVVVKSSVDSSSVLTQPLDVNIDTSQVQDLYGSSDNPIDPTVSATGENTLEQDALMTQEALAADDQVTVTELVTEASIQKDIAQIDVVQDVVTLVKGGASNVDPAYEELASLSADGSTKANVKGSVSGKPLVQNEPERSALASKSMATAEASASVSDGPVEVVPGIKISKTGFDQSLNALVKRGYAQFKSGDIPGAQSIFQNIIANHSNNVPARLGLAAVYFKQKNYSESLGQYQKVLELDTSNLQAQEGMLSIAKFSKSTPMMLSQLESLLLKYPESGHLHFVKGTLFAQNNSWRRANQAFHSALLDQPDRADYIFNLAVSYDQLNQPEKALLYYKNALRAAENSPSLIPIQQTVDRIQYLER